MTDFLFFWNKNFQTGLGGHLQSVQGPQREQEHFQGSAYACSVLCAGRHVLHLLGNCRTSGGVHSSKCVQSGHGSFVVDAGHLGLHKVRDFVGKFGKYCRIFEKFDTFLKVDIN